LLAVLLKKAEERNEKKRKGARCTTESLRQPIAVGSWFHVIGQAIVKVVRCIQDAPKQHHTLHAA
jgi:hypothetical protein